MVETINLNFNKLKEAIENTRKYSNLIKTNKSPRNNWRRELILWKGKISHYYKKIINTGQGNIVKVIYRESSEMYDDVVEAVFTNISEEDVKTLLKVREEIFGYKLEILEINSYPTYFKRIEDYDPLNNK